MDHCKCSDRFAQSHKLTCVLIIERIERSKQQGLKGRVSGKAVLVAYTTSGDVQSSS